MRRIIFLVLAGILLPSALVVNAQVLLSDNFNSENGGLGQLNYNNFANWTVANSGSGGTVDLIGNGFFDFYPGNGLYVDLLGSGNGTPGLLQSKAFSFVPGVTYTLSFDLAGSDRGVDNDVDMTLGSILSKTLDLPSAQGYTLFTYTFTVSSPISANLDFENVQSGDAGAILDNVNLSGSSVPDGGNTAMLAAVALLALAAGAARTRKYAMAAN